ncbi:MAG: copper resistance protein CopC [Hydrogenophaga sp.]|nr:copper resistance protein CopC [Hydrogenophaga sp.]
MNTRRKMVSWLVALLAMAATGTALAHAALVKSEPARRATLSKPPPQVRLWFNERLEPEYATISVIREGAGPVTTQKARVDKDDAKLLALELPVLSPGTYTVKYRVLSVDGHTVDYGYTFTVKAEGAGK